MKSIVTFNLLVPQLKMYLHDRNSVPEASALIEEILAHL